MGGTRSVGQRRKAMLINTEGLFLIGPGSEWFWTALQFFVVAISLWAIYRQVEGQSAANFLQRMEMLNNVWASPRMSFIRLDAAIHLRYGEPDQECYQKARPILDFFADLQNLEVERFIRVKEIHANFGGSMQEWVAFTKPLVDARRKAAGSAHIYNLEPLLEKLREFERKQGIEPERLDDSTIPGLLDEAIARASTALRQEKAWQSGTIPSIPAVPKTDGPSVEGAPT